MKDKLSFLGIGSGFSTKNTSAWFVRNNRLVLIDCGATVFSQLQTDWVLDKKWAGVDVIVTHLHLDHVGSLSQLGLYYYFQKKQSINVISKCKDIDTFLSITDLGQNEAVPGFPKVRYTKENKYNITFIPTKHSIVIDSYGFFMPSADGNGGFVYTGDTTTLDPFLPYLDKGKATDLYLDASVNGGAHLKLADNMNLLKSLCDEGINVYLMHLDDEFTIRKIIHNTKIKIAGDVN